MNDNIIINAISKIYFIIVSFLSFIFIVLCVVFILLQNGISIEKISTSSVEIKKLYIKWNEKLSISVDEVKIIKKNEAKSTTLDYKKFKKVFKQLKLFDDWFEKITIKKITFNNISASFSYLYGEDGYFMASSPEFILKSSLSTNSDFLVLNIKNFEDIQRNIKISGNIFISTKDPQVITSLNMNINNDASIDVYNYFNETKAYYKLKSRQKIKDIAHIINLFNLDDAIKYWAYDAIKMSYATLDEAYGWLEYENIDKAYKNLYVKATVNDLDYTYNKEVDPIHSKYTILEFKNSALYIYPKEAYTYNFYLDKSWLKVDFAKKEELLSIMLLFKAVLNQDLLHLLHTYQIDLPFMQNTGSVNTNLQIDVNLRTIDVTAKGDFFTKSANFDYLGLNIDIYDAYISLNNYDVSIKNMMAKYQNTATAMVDVEFDAKNSKGIIDFQFNKIDFKELNIFLDSTNKPLHAKYIVKNGLDTISVEKSEWKFKSLDISLEKMNIDFDMNTLKAKVPTTFATVKNMANGYISGNFVVNPLKIDLNIDLLKFSHSGVKLFDTTAPIHFTYDKQIVISSLNDIRFIIDTMQYTIAKSTISIKDNNLSIEKSALQIENLLQTDIKGSYNFNTNTSSINLTHLNIQNKSLGEIFSNIEQTTLLMKYKNKTLTLHSKEFDIDYILNDQSWKLKFNTLNTLANQSKILSDYNLTDGNFTLYKNVYNKHVNFYGDFKYPYKILVEDEEPLEYYHINGSKKENILLTINNKVDINISDTINVTAKDIGININDVLKFFNDRKDNNTSDSKKPNVMLKSTGCYIFVSKHRRIISETLDLQYYNGVTTAQLAYKDGAAGFELKNDSFHLYGNEFNDEFMEHLFAFSKFKNGSLSFSMNGTTKEYEGILYVADTIILDYKILNNILAFVNTIPSLVTFSLPGYSSHGLAVKDAYMHFKAKDNVFKLSDIYIDSKELDILGRGTANLNTNKIDLQLNLKTDLGSSISKIPVVGYILLGDDTVSTTLKITGPLDDPKVESLLAEDIIVAPLNIIKRTFLLPYHLITGE